MANYADLYETTWVAPILPKFNAPNCIERWTRTSTQKEPLSAADITWADKSQSSYELTQEIRHVIEGLPPVAFIKAVSDWHKATEKLDREKFLTHLADTRDVDNNHLNSLTSRLRTVAIQKFYKEHSVSKKAKLTAKFEKYGEFVEANKSLFNTDQIDLGVNKTQVWKVAVGLAERSAAIIEYNREKKRREYYSEPVCEESELEKSLKKKLKGNISSLPALLEYLGIASNFDEYQLEPRVINPRFWSRKINTLIRAARERAWLLIAPTHVTWCSKDGFKERVQMIDSQRKWAELHEFINEEGTKVPAPTPEQKAERQHAELLARSRGAADSAVGNRAYLITVTTPSRFHPTCTCNAGKSDEYRYENHNYDINLTPKHAQAWLKAHDLETMRAKRLVFIIDECHRSTFGDMLIDIKKSFPGAVFFGFSGTPIHKENVRKDNTTTDVFGDELHRYSIADGIRDKNVLGFDPYQVLTYRDRDLRQAVALEKAKTATPAEAFASPAKKKVFNHYMNDVPMAGHRDSAGVYQPGIEDHLPSTQYSRNKHQSAVVQDIADNWVTLSQGSKFHAIFATSSVTEAITYYRLMKAQCPDLKITALFDPNISDEDGGGDPVFKTNGLVEIIGDYNASYGHTFDLGSHGNFKKDLAARLAHRAPYIRMASEPDKRLDLLIVVNQMLTGFDSKWVNTLYLDKLLAYENIIQAFSRTNRLFGPDKPFGTIRYYRKPHTMTRNVAAAVKLYSGDKPIGLFADRLPLNLERMNASFAEMSAIFAAAGIVDFIKLPGDLAERAAFAKNFQEFNKILEAAKIQGFTWEKADYDFDEPKTRIELAFTHHQYLTLLQRYKELGGGAGGVNEAIPFEIDSHITEIDTGKIDADYMNSRFDKYLKVLQSGNEQAKETTLAELHRSFSSLSQEEQKIADIFLHDIQRGDVQIDAHRTFRDYITDYQARAKHHEIDTLVARLGVDKTKLVALMNTHVTQANLNEFGRFDDLKATVDQQKAKTYFEGLEGKELPLFRVNIRTAKLLQDFIIQGGLLSN